METSQKQQKRWGLAAETSIENWNNTRSKTRTFYAQTQFTHLFSLNLLYSNSLNIKNQPCWVVQGTVFQKVIWRDYFIKCASFSCKAT